MSLYYIIFYIYIYSKKNNPFMRRTSNRELYGIRTVIIMIYTPIREKKKKKIYKAK